jgi:mannose-1-phosphate guanylyltransferase
MAGGVGSRFWPMSRQTMPKQYLDILGTGSSLIQLTYERFTSLCVPENFLVVTSREYTKITQEHLSQISTDQILGEPFRKNTAPCIAYAAYKLYKKNPEAIMVITPADHIILKQNSFIETMETAIKYAGESEHLITLGIRPTRPDSGYGYIQFHRDSDYGHADVKRVKTFTEKPSVDLALQFLQSGDFYWNSGMFIWKAKSIVEAFNKFMPDLAKSFEEHLSEINTDSEERAIQKIYAECQNISIDYGIMEQADNVDVVLGREFGWSDLGTWGSLFEQLKTEGESNVVLGNKINLYDTQQSIVMMPKDKLAVIQGLANFIVIDTPDVLLICQKDEEQKIKQFVQDIKQDKESKFL